MHDNYKQIPLPLDGDKFQTLTTQLGLSESTIQLIQRIRHGQPTRRVSSSGSNVTGSYPSRKMGRTISFESLHVEFNLILELENDHEVLEYFDQPCEIILKYVDKNGKNAAARHIPDFFVIKKDCAGWIEAKPFDSLRKLVESKPWRYQIRPTGSYFSTPGEAYASELGLGYKIWTPNPNSLVYRNLHFLSNYLDRDLSETALTILTKKISEHLPCKMEELLRKNFKKGEIFTLLALQQIFADLNHDNLIQNEDYALFPSITACEAYSMARSKKALGMFSEEKNPLETIKGISSEQLELIMTKYQAAMQGKGVSKSTFYRYNKAIKESQAATGNPLEGLVSKNHLKGNRKPGLNPEVYKIMDRLVREEYLSKRHPSRKAVYSLLCHECFLHGLIPPSKKTFYKSINVTKTEELKSRFGNKAAYKVGEYQHLKTNTPRHGNYPFERVHIDHTELDIEIVSSVNGTSLGRPWLTIAFDAFSRKVLGHYLTLECPSYRSCMAIVRSIVQKTGYLPQTIVSDRGKEFESIYYNALLASLKICKILRPPAKARFGSVLERFFGTTTQKILFNLSGNTEIRKNPRSQSKESDPSKLAAWSFKDLNQLLEKYFYDVYPNEPHAGLLDTPQAVFNKSMEQIDFLQLRKQSYDNKFVIRTLPTTKKGNAKIIAGMGLKIHGLYYWNDSFKRPDVESTQVEIKYDPWDISIAYALVNGEWHLCQTLDSTLLLGLTEWEMKHMLPEIKERRRLLNKAGISKSMAELLHEATKKDKDLIEERKETQKESSKTEEPKKLTSNASFFDQVIQNSSEDLTQKFKSDGSNYE